MINNEIWKTIEEFDNYEVSNLGRVRNIQTGRVLKPILISTGYYQVGLFKQNKCYRKLIHRLVAEAFLENSDNLPQINHIDEDKTNNVVSNLEWCSASYNINYGTRNKRIGISHAKKVQCIETGEIFDCAKDVARKYNLEIFSVSNAANQNHTQKTAGSYHWCYI